MVGMQDFNTPEKPQWCPGCGNYAIHIALKQALAELSLEPHETVIVSGIGCGSKMPHYIRSYGYEGIHGRLLPLAAGIKIANPSLHVIAVGGDGDGYSEGGNHFVHFARENFNINYFVQDNHVYGLTTGQTAPTTPKGMKTKTAPKGNRLEVYRHLPIAMSAGATFVATAFAGDVKHMKEVFKRAIQHKGFSYVNIFQPCVTWDYIGTYEWYKERVYKLEESGHNPKDWHQAWEKAWEMFRTNYEKIPIGVIYEEERETADEFFSPGNKNLVNLSLSLPKEGRDVSFLVEEMK